MENAKIYMLFSSSKGNAAYIKHGRDEILIDCGVSARAIDNSLKTLGTSLKNISAVFITHEHGDHIRGLPIISKYHGMPIYAPNACCEYLSENINGAHRLHPLPIGEAVELRDSAVCAIPTPHDSRGSVGFRIRAGEEKIGYFTDIGHLSEGVLRGLSGCKRVVIESNHDIDMLRHGSYPYSLKQRILGAKGHLSNELCAKLLPHLVHHGAESFMLAHLSEENNLPELAYRESYRSLVDNGIEVETGYPSSVRLNVAPVCGIKELK